MRDHHFFGIAGLLVIIFALNISNDIAAAVLYTLGGLSLLFAAIWWYTFER